MFFQFRQSDKSNDGHDNELNGRIRIDDILFRTKLTQDQSCFARQVIVWNQSHGDADTKGLGWNLEMRR